MRQTTTPKERMQEVLASLGITANEFESRCGLGSGFVARLTRNITRRSRQKIKEVFPEINMDYVSLNYGKPFETPSEPMPTMKERIMQFCKTMEITETEFCRRAGLASTFVTNMSDNIRRSSLEQIMNTFPMLNIQWLQLGEGKMISKERKGISTSTDKTSSRIREAIRYLGVTNTIFERETGVSLASIHNANNITQRQITKITERYPHINPIWLMYGHGEMMNAIPKDVKMLPLVTQRDFNAFTKTPDDMELLSSFDTIPAKEGRIAFEVAGDSMDDNSYFAYLNGDTVICDEPKEMLIRNFDYVIVHRNGIMLRRIKQIGDEYILHALNRNYPDIRIPENNIRKVYVVLKKISSQRH